LVMMKIVTADATDDERDVAAFPADHKLLFNQLRKYV